MTAAVAPCDQLLRTAQAEDMAVSPTAAKAQMLAVTLAPIECRLGISANPNVTAAGALQVEPGGCRLRKVSPTVTMATIAISAEKPRDTPSTPATVGSARRIAVAPAISR